MTAIGAVYSAVPFIQSMNPTQKTINDNVLNIDISDIKPGSYKYINWKYAPVIIYIPDKKSIQTLISYNNDVYGQAISTDNENELYVYQKVSTYKGCLLDEIQEHYKDRSLPEGWYDTCHMGAWDYTGRSFKKHFVPEDFRLPNLIKIEFKRINNNTIQIQKN